MDMVIFRSRMVLLFLFIGIDVLPFGVVAQEKTKDAIENQLVLYKQSNINKLRVISPGDKISIMRKGNDGLTLYNVIVARISKTTITTSGGKVPIADILAIKHKMEGKSKQRTGLTLLFCGIGGSGLVFGSTFLQQNIGVLMGQIVFGGATVFSFFYGVPVLIVGISQSNKWYDIENNWRAEVEEHVKPGYSVPTDVVK